MIKKAVNGIEYSRMENDSNKQQSPMLIRLLPPSNHRPPIIFFPACSLPLSSLLGPQGEEDEGGIDGRLGQSAVVADITGY